MLNPPSLIEYEQTKEIEALRAQLDIAVEGLLQVQGHCSQGGEPSRVEWSVHKIATERLIQLGVQVGTEVKK